jgi:hypothetical protein
MKTTLHVLNGFSLKKCRIKFSILRYRAVASINSTASTSIYQDMSKLTTAVI